MSMNGGRREKVKAFILSAALFYTLKSSADERPLFAPILFDEAFIKSDMDTTQTAIKAMLGFGFNSSSVAPMASRRQYFL